jgi:hypothetical protein
MLSVFLFLYQNRIFHSKGEGEKLIIAKKKKVLKRA